MKSIREITTDYGFIVEDERLLVSLRADGRPCGLSHMIMTLKHEAIEKLYYLIALKLTLALFSGSLSKPKKGINLI